MGVELKKKPIKLGAKRNVSPPAEDTALLQLPEPQQDQAGDVRASGIAVFANFFLLLFGSGTFALPRGFARAGAFEGVIGVCIVASITYATINMLVATKKRLLRRLSALPGQEEGPWRSLGYAAVATHALGTPLAGTVVKCATL